MGRGVRGEEGGREERNGEGGREERNGEGGREGKCVGEREGGKEDRDSSISVATLDSIKSTPIHVKYFELLPIFLTLS